MSKPKKPRPLPTLSRPAAPAKKNVSTPEDPDAGMMPDEPPKTDPLAGMSKEAIERMMGDQSEISFEDDSD